MRLLYPRQIGLAAKGIFDSLLYQSCGGVTQTNSKDISYFTKKSTIQSQALVLSESILNLLLIVFKSFVKYSIYIYFFIFACLLIFFDFLQSDWLQQRAAFYDILTVVQKCYFFTTRKE